MASIYEAARQPHRLIDAEASTTPLPSSANFLDGRWVRPNPTDGDGSRAGGDLAGTRHRVHRLCGSDRTVEEQGPQRNAAMNESPAPTVSTTEAPLLSCYWPGLTRQLHRAGPG